MTRSRLPFAVALVAAAALVLAAAAAPSRTARHLGQQATNQELIVVPFASRLGQANADTGVALVFPTTQAGPQKVVVYVPGGYGLDLAAPPGTTIGTAGAGATTSAGAVTLRGNIVVDSPTRYAADPAAIACAGSSPHSTVWLLQLAAGATSLTVPVFVDIATGTDGGLGVFKLQMCFPASDVPQALGGAPSGLRLGDVFLEPTKGLTNPPSLGAYVWRAFITPYTPGTTTPNPAGTTEVRSIIPLPQVLTLKGRYEKSTKSFVLSGVLSLAGDTLAGVDVAIYGSTKSAVSTFKRLTAVKTKTKGVYSHRRKAAKTMYFGSLVDEYFTGARCDTGPSTAPAGCVQENVSIETFSNLVAVKVPVKKKKK
ncbi:MAG: hypothetical protein QOG29_446 [Gaiellaceae bacterium]|nr:hypothetical protein [Gaiellaceae bacterium]